MNPLLSQIGEIDEERCGLEAYAITSSEPNLRKLTLKHDENTGGFYSDVKHMIFQDLIERYLAADAVYKKVDDVYSNQKCFYVIDQTEEYQPFGNLIGGSVPFDYDDLENIRGFSFVFSCEELTIICYQHVRSLSIPNRRNKNILTQLFRIDGGGVLLDRQKEPLLTLFPKIDAVIFKNRIYTDEISMMERSFKFNELILQKANMAVKAVDDSEILINPEKLRSYVESPCKSHKPYLKKLMRVSKSPILDMSIEVLADRINCSDKWRGKFVISAGKIELDTIKNVEDFIDLLDERYTKSEITRLVYDTDAKKRADESVEQL